MKTAEIEREYGPSPGFYSRAWSDLRRTRCLPCRWRQTPSVRSGKRKADEVRSVLRKDTWVGVYSSECSERFGVRYPHWLPIQESERVLNALAVKLFPCFLHAIAEMRR